MCIVSIKYKYKEKDDWIKYQDEKFFDELGPEYLLQCANVFVREILEKHPNAVITEICIW